MCLPHTSSASLVPSYSVRLSKLQTCLAMRLPPLWRRQAPNEHPK